MQAAGRTVIAARPPQLLTRHGLHVPPPVQVTFTPAGQVEGMENNAPAFRTRG